MPSTVLKPAQPPQITTDTRFIYFDMDEIRDLKHCYEETLKTILEDMPDVNWNSIPEIKAHFAQAYLLALPDTKISTLQRVVDSENQNFGFRCIDELVHLIELQKIKYAIRNYLDCIIKHQVDGKVALREVEGKWLMPNKQSVPHSADILACVMKTK